jgi:SpoIID/LytB domain protein
LLRRVYAGQLTVTARRGELVPIVAMDTETAVAIIVASEMPKDAPVEALKAQAVVTKSFLRGGLRHGNFDLCDTTHCQYLRSPDDVTPRV